MRLLFSINDIVGQLIHLKFPPLNPYVRRPAQAGFRLVVMYHLTPGAIGPVSLRLSLPPQNRLASMGVIGCELEGVS